MLLFDVALVWSGLNLHRNSLVGFGMLLGLFELRLGVVEELLLLVVGVGVGVLNLGVSL